VILNIIIKQTKNAKTIYLKSLILTLSLLEKKAAKPKAPLCDVWMIFI